jgi:hypothetical protein
VSYSRTTPKRSMAGSSPPSLGPVGLELAQRFVHDWSSLRTLPPSGTKGDGLFWYLCIRMCNVSPGLYCFVCTLVLSKDSFVQAQGSVLCWKLYRGAPRAQHGARSSLMASPCQCDSSRYSTLYVPLPYITYLTDSCPIS